MNITYLKSASVIIEDNDVKILSDPWLVDGEYFGSWAHYPPCNFVPKDFDVDFIYITHIHPDHFSSKTLSKMNKNIPIIILKFQSEFLKKNIEKLGFTVLELEHNKRTHLKNNLHINILAADNCNPELCSKFLGCGPAETNFKMTSIDTMCVIDNGSDTLVNTNDCPYELSKFSAKEIKQQYNKIDMLLIGYGGAGPYPQCFKMKNEEKILEAKKKSQEFLTQGEQYINLFRPEFYMPFAGRYTLAGKKSPLNQYRGVPELEEAYDYFSNSKHINQKLHKCIILNSLSSFNISSGKSSDDYIRTDLDAKEAYINNVLLKTKFDYEYEPIPTLIDLEKFLPKCYKRFESIRKKISFSSDSTILIDLPENSFVAVSCCGQGFNVFSNNESKKFSDFIRLTIDPRLLKWLFLGPAYAHWSSAEIGSHITYERNPNIFERSLYYCMSFFYQ